MKRYYMTAESADRVERRNVYGVKAIWPHPSKQKCIEKAKK